MRTYSSIILALALAAPTGCKWTEFDDLEKEAWVGSTTKPNDDSTDYGVALARGQRSSTSGGKLVVIGAGQAQFTELAYASNGDTDLAPTALKLNTQFGIGNLDPQPILIADPATDEVSLIVNSGGQSIAVLHGVGGLIAHQVFGPQQPDAAAYVQPPPRTDPGHVGEAQAVQPIIAGVDPGAPGGASVFGAFFGTAPSTQPKAALVDDTNAPIQVRGLTGARITSTTYDDLVVWTSTGKLIVYDGNAGWDPSITMATPLNNSTIVDTGFQPGKGSQLITIDDRYVLLVGHKDIGNADSYLAIYDAAAMTTSPPMIEPKRLGNPITIPELRTATVLTSGTTKYVVAGYPGAIVESVKAGQVLVFEANLTTGLNETPAMTLYDAQPETEQQFGRAVAVTPFNGQNVIAVGADNEVFTYFRTKLYAETRQGQ